MLLTDVETENRRQCQLFNYACRVNLLASCVMSKNLLFKLYNFSRKIKLATLNLYYLYSCYLTFNQLYVYRYI